jgi:hypothetical protein
MAKAIESSPDLTQNVFAVPHYQGSDSGIPGKDEGNHILLYPSALNPPHPGHPAVLQSELFDGVTNLNRIEAIFVVTEDRRPKDKKSRSGRDFHHNTEG